MYGEKKNKKKPLTFNGKGEECGTTGVKESIKAMSFRLLAKISSSEGR